MRASVNWGASKRKQKVNLLDDSRKLILGSHERSLVAVSTPLASPLTRDGVERNIGGYVNLFGKARQVRSTTHQKHAHNSLFDPYIPRCIPHVINYA